MRVEYKKVPEKNWGLHVQGANRALRDKLVAFVSFNTQWMSAPNHAAAWLAKPFVQSDSYGGRFEAKSKVEFDPDSYLFIEFWSPMTKHAEFLKLMMQDAGIATSHPEVHADIND